MITNKLDDEQKVKFESYKEELHKLGIGEREGFVSAVEDPLIRCALIAEWNKILKEKKDGQTKR